MRDLISRKAEIMMAHQANLAKINGDILALATKALLDKKVKGGAKVSFLNLIRGEGGIESESSTGMGSGDKLELAKMYFQNAENIRKEVGNDPAYASILKDFDMLLESYQKELDGLDAELRSAEEEDKRARLLERRSRVREKV